MTHIAIIGASNEDDRGPGMQLGEALRGILPKSVFVSNYSVGGCVTADFVRQADEANGLAQTSVAGQPDAVIIGLSGELLMRTRTAIDLLRNVVRVYFKFTDAQILVQKYPENLIDVVRPDLIQRSKQYEKANLLGYNASLDNHNNIIKHVHTVEWPEYYTDYYLTGVVDEDPIHATAGNQVAMACRVVNRLRDLGVDL